MKLSLKEILFRMLGRRPRPDWFEGLSLDQRRQLASNLRRITESKRTLEKQLNRGAPQR